ncbi:MAG: hypothetical protein H0X44_03890 [Acidobacteria bacterium]|nr:hypothetical protein [Acidobacteriota bacterium]
MAERNDDKTRGTDVLGLRDVTPDRPADERRDDKDDEREGVGTAGEVERISGKSSVQRSKGATGIDMGAGGEGTDIEP